MERIQAQYHPDYDRFLLHSKNYVVQYNQTYLQRFNQMKQRLKLQIETRWGRDIPLPNKIIDVENENYRGRECALIGMLFKDMKLRGSILDDFKDGIPTSLQPMANLASDKDNLILEDQSGRVALIGSLQSLIPELVSGIIIAIKGQINEFGEFVVSDHLFAYKITDSQPCIPTSILDDPPVDGKLVLFVSGLSLGSTKEDNIHEIALQLLVDFILGKYGDETLTRIASRIARVIIAGDSVVAPDDLTFKERFNTQKNRDSLANPSKQLDLWVAQILGSCPVEIMPGMLDPANVAIPQQPFHPCLFPHSARFNLFERVPNPTQFRLNEIIVAGHAGQPLNDIARQSYQVGDVSSLNGNTVGSDNSPDAEPEPIPLQSMDSMPMDIDETIIDLDQKPTKIRSNLKDGERRLEILQQTLEWGHLAPTVPDTLPCYPFGDTDPFIIEPNHMPDILFAGNQPSFSSRFVTITDNDQVNKKVRLICVPKFRESGGTIVLCDISQSDYPCYALRFS